MTQFALVKLLNGFAKPLTYKIPDSWDKNSLKGTLVRVPLQKRTELAVIEETFGELPINTTFNVRELVSLERFPSDKNYQKFIETLSSYYAVEPLVFYQRIRAFLNQKEVIVEEQEVTAEIGTEIKLTHEQQDIVDALSPTINNPEYKPVLIHGVTGSGKTEIYKKLIIKAFEDNKTTILLLPEVTLATQFAKLLRAQLPTISLFSFHSASSVKEKRALWEYINDDKPAIIVGVHLPIMLPLSNLGLIIVDEEHDTGYQEKKQPRVNTKEAALLRAQIYSIPIILGSATPSTSSLYNIKTRNWQFFTITKRFAGAFPTIKTINLLENKKRANFWISKELHTAIQDRLDKKEQTIIFLNRRGYSFFVQCNNCSFIFSCKHCSVSLTLHNNNIIRCHYCDYQTASPTQCTSCKAPEKNLLKKGIGTQQLVTILEKIFPTARIDRLDLDMTVNKKKSQEVLTKLSSGELDILVGTQSITKGYHFPKVTLVGIIWADIQLNFPTYNAAETTLQQLIQVAGRAGRQTQESLVIVQTMAQHPIFKYLEEINYTKFFDYEIEHRKLTNYPPCTRFAEIELRNTSQNILEEEAELCAQFLEQYCAKNNLAVTLLGPAEPPVSKIKNIFIRKIYLKSSTIQPLIKAYKLLQAKNLTSSIFFTPNPLN